MALPHDSTLLAARDIDGLSHTQLAATYDVPVEAIDARFEAMGRSIDPERERETDELMAAIRHYKTTGHGAEDAVLRGHHRGWEPSRISSRTGVDTDTVSRILAGLS
jgi:hypothetical protein